MQSIFDSRRLESSNRPGKSRLIALLLCFFIFPFGAHRFYVGRPVSAIFYLLTLGGLGFWCLIDLLLILFGSFRDSQGYAVTEWLARENVAGLVAVVLSIAVLIASITYVSQNILETSLKVMFSELFEKVSAQISKFREGSTKEDNKVQVPLPFFPLTESTPVGKKYFSGTESALVRYYDKDGKANYVSSLSQVPPEYRAKAETNVKLPNIIREPGR